MRPGSRVVIVGSFPIRENVILNLIFNFLGTRQSLALSSATQHAMPPDHGEKWGTSLNRTEYLNTKLPGSLSLPYYVRDTT